MKHPRDQFLYILGLFEIHRHTPGVLKLIASPENPSGTPLNEAFFLVHFGYSPPAIFVETIDAVLNTPNQKEETRVMMQHVLDTACKEGRKRVPVQVYAFRGGHMPTFLPALMPGDILERNPGVIHTVHEDIQHLSREPATDAKGDSLSFTLDEVDFYAMDARKNYRQPKANDKAYSSSPKTIYHYVEEQVAKGKHSAFIAWRNDI